MTREQIEAMSDEEIARAVATEVMGWRQMAKTNWYEHEEEGDDYELDFGQGTDSESVPFNPVTRYDSAGLVIGAMEAKGWDWERKGASFQFIKNSRVYECFHGRWRRAMCESALLAVTSQANGGEGRNRDE